MAIVPYNLYLSAFLYLKWDKNKYFLRVERLKIIVYTQGKTLHSTNTQ